MAIIDRIKFDGAETEWLIFKYPGEDFVMGSQLIVGEGQVAVFVKGGKALDFFTAGTYTLSTANIPLLQGIINLPFGGQTPFTAEIYFINKTAKLDLNWGTIDPIQLVDPKYNIKLRVRAFGQFGMRVDDYRVFMTELIGTLNPMEVVSYEKILNFFKGILVMKIKSLIAQSIINNKISALEVTALIDKISEFCKAEISEEFNRFGMKVLNFYIQSINFPDEDFDAINQILKQKAEFDLIGDQRYVTKRSFDTMETAAGNEGGLAGTFVGAGVGLGAGIGIGRSFSDLAAKINTNAPQVNIQVQSESADTIKKCSKCGKEFTEDVAFCNECGEKFDADKIKCTACDKEIDADSKFCPFCGVTISQSIICPQCNTENVLGSKFCKKCGAKLGAEL